MAEDFANYCVKRTLVIFQSKWSARIIFELSQKEPLRFSELKKQINGITNTMLSNTLKGLEGDGLILRTQFNEIPPHVEYSLSKSGKDFSPVFDEMAKWGSKYL